MELYLYSMSDPETGEAFFKIGVSENAAKRFSWGTVSVKDSNLPLKEKASRMLSGQGYIPDHPYVSKLIHSVEFGAEGFAWAAEAELLEVLRETKIAYRPQKAFSGQSECFRCDDEVKTLIINWMKEKSAAAPKHTTMLYYKVAELSIKDTDPLSKHKKVIERLTAEGRWPPKSE